MTATATYNKPAFSGNYPAHWQLLRIKNIFSEIEDRSTDGNEELLSVSHYTGVTLKRDSLENEDDFITNAESLEGYKRVKQGDLVINIMLAWNGSLGISPFDGITSPAYCVYRVKENNNPEYFGYLFSTNLMKAEFRKKSTGIIDSRLRLYSDKFFSIFSVVPPVEEQNQIVEYIKKQSEKINRFIAKKQSFIDLLKEQRQSVINEAVTKGINKKIKLKDSGIKWLEHIPQHWEIRRLGSIGKFSKGGNVSKADLQKDGEFAVVLYGDIYTKYEFSINKVANRIDSDVAANAVHLSRYDILFTGSGEDKNDIGKCVAFNGDEETYAGGDVIIFKQSEFDSEFISYSQNSAMAKYQKHVSSKGDIIVHTYASKLKDVKMPFPKSIHEQQQIVEYIKTETATIDKAIAKAEREIELITEYKEAMISEAVMGKAKIYNTVNAQ